jgi:hypothetical protein
MSNTSPTKKEREDYGRDAFAVSSLRTADIEIDRLLECHQGADRDFVLIEAISASILIFYLRPFKGRDPFRLDKSIVPAEFLDLHKGFEDMRDKVIAHRDANLPLASWGGPNDFGFIFDGQTIMPSVYKSLLDPIKAIELKKLIHCLLQILAPRIGSFYQKHLNAPPPPGHYLISIENTPASWFTMV